MGVAGNTQIDLRNQAYLGSEHFVARLQAGISENIDLSEFPRSQRRPKPLALDEYKRGSGSRNDAIARAYAQGNRHFLRFTSLLREQNHFNGKRQDQIPFVSLSIGSWISDW
jgi:hypothetical protein